MAQGKAWNKEKILKVLQPYFQLGYNRRRACIAAGLDSSLLAHWEKKQPELSVQIDAWIYEVNAIARKNVVEKIKKGDLNQSTWWLERRESQEFSTRTEQHNTHEGQLNVLKIIHDDTNRSDPGPTQGQELEITEPVQD